MIKVLESRRGIPRILFSCVIFMAGIRGNLFQGAKNSDEQIFLPLKCLYLLVLYKKSTLSDHSFKKLSRHSLNFVYLCYFYGGY